jgi:ribosomal protein S14
MGAPIETVSVSQNPETITRMEVTCIFCGRPTPVPASDPSKFASHVPRRISIVRCKVCGKEAPYRACDIFEFGEMCHARGF